MEKYPKCRPRNRRTPPRGLGDLQLIDQIRDSWKASEGLSGAVELEVVRSDEFVNKLVHG